MKVTIFSASVNPSYDYDLEKIGRMTYDEAENYFRNEDTIGACSCNTNVVDLTKDNEQMICADGANLGDGSDTMFVWWKVTL